jgi:REP-associated tyrosine transposase
MSYRKTSHSVYDLKYHTVLITKYRKAVLQGQIALRVRELIRQTCATLDVYIVSGHVSKDHVHLLLSVPPNVSVSELVKRMKGRSSRRMLDEFTELRRQFWGRHMWARGYFAASTGNVTDEIIQQYIESQELVDESSDDNFSVGSP